MKIINLKSNEINQNGYHKNILTKDKIGFIFIAPTLVTPEDCLACDGYVLKVTDYEKLFKVIGTKYNLGSEKEDEFRIPDYNITGRFLQPGGNIGAQISAGLPNITGGWNNVGAEPGYNYASGAVYGNNINGNFFYHANGRGGTVGGFYLNAARSSAVYGKSTTVQPPSQIVHLVIKYK